MPKKQRNSFIPSIWAQKLLNDFYDNITLSTLIAKDIEAQKLWDLFKSDLGVTDMELHESKHIPDIIKKMIDKHTEKEGRRAGLNFIYARHWQDFKNAMLLSGAHVTDDKDVAVPVGNSWVVIGTGQAINVADLDIFFGILNGTYNREGVAEATKHGNHIKITRLP